MSDESNEQMNQAQSQEVRAEGEQQGSNSGGENSLRNRALAGLGRVMHELGSRLVERFDDSDGEHSESP